MKIKLLYFAALREDLGQEGEELELASPLTGSSLIEALQARYPKAKDILGACSIAQNEEYSPLNQEIQEQALVALIPPVSGG